MTDEGDAYGRTSIAARPAAARAALAAGSALAAASWDRTVANEPHGVAREVAAPAWDPWPTGSTHPAQAGVPTAPSGAGNEKIPVVVPSHVNGRVDHDDRDRGAALLPARAAIAATAPPPPPPPGRPLASYTLESPLRKAA